MRVITASALLSFFGLGVFLGCHEISSSPADAATDATPDRGVGGASPDAGLPSSGKPLAYGCSANDECASGSCADGVCCNTACTDQCASCNQTANPGYCMPLDAGEDLNAAQPCTGAKTCGVPIPVLNILGCRLKDAETCTSNAECASLVCATYYADADHDGYGGSNALHLCESSGATAPPGYVAVGGDCCDSDPNAFPGQTAYFTNEDVCGSWDYSCDGKVETANGLSPTECGETLNTGHINGNYTLACH